MTYEAKYSIYQHSYTRQFEADNKDHAWCVFWNSTRHTGEHCLANDKGVLLSLLRQRAYVTLNSITEKKIPACRFTDPAYLKAERAVARVERSIRRNVR